MTRYRFYPLTCIGVLFFLFSFHLHAQKLSPKYLQLQKKLARGWNTWDYGSMLSHVRLPDGLMMKINFRQSFIGTPGDPSFFLHQFAVDRSGLVTPVAHSVNGSYTELLINDWKGNSIRVQSTTNMGEIYLLITPIKSSKDIHYNIELEVGFLWNRAGHLSRKSQSIIASDIKSNTTINSTSNILKVYQPYPTPYLVVKGDTTVSFYTGLKKDISEIIKIITVASSRYEQQSKKFDSLADGYNAIRSVLGWNTIFDPEQNRVITPVARGWNQAWQGFVLFEWDTFFASFLFGLIDKEYAYSNAIAVVKGINNKGHLGHWQMPGKQSATSMSQPPVGSMICWKLFEKFNDKWFLQEVYHELLTWNRWWMKNRINGGQLTWGGWQNSSVQIARWESGLDNSPMYDSVTMAQVNDQSLMNLADVGLNSLYAADCTFLAKIASALGHKADEQELLQRASFYYKKIAQLWNEEKGIYLNRYIDSGKWSMKLSPTLFYPFLAGVPNPLQAERMIKEHFNNPDEFYGSHLLPSISRNDSAYDNQYWRGSIWPPMNFLIYLGLKQYRPELAAELSKNSYKTFIDAWRIHHCVFENINSQKGVAKREDQLNCDPFYHWGALMGIMQFMEDGKY
ncbi:MAG: hypothetical protein H7122_00645 [Chitinophagaceae bacterium]|nr:hypothetical protein [Chitinophagaceae bacterium]